VFIFLEKIPNIVFPENLFSGSSSYFMHKGRQVILIGGVAEASKN
jgi:hypothetical protein